MVFSNQNVCMCMCVCVNMYVCYCSEVIWWRNQVTHSKVKSVVNGEIWWEFMAKKTNKHIHTLYAPLVIFMKWRDWNWSSLFRIENVHNGEPRVEHAQCKLRCYVILSLPLSSLYYRVYITACAKLLYFSAICLSMNYVYVLCNVPSSGFVCCFHNHQELSNNQQIINIFIEYIIVIVSNYYINIRLYLLEQQQQLQRLFINIYI